MDRDRHIQTVEDGIAQLTRRIGTQANGGDPGLPALPPRTQHSNAIVDACKKAADMIRDVHKTHEAEAETLARHMEQIGDNLKNMCDEVAKQIRDARVMPKEMAEETANELLEIGSKEADRHDRVSNGLLAARKAVLDINPPAEENFKPVSSLRTPS
jgi:hypothetical protein